MKEKILHVDNKAETFFAQEGCHILEMLQAGDDQEISIARARVAPGCTTSWHSLKNTTEHYLILSGHGRVEVGELKVGEVGAGDIVLIPPECRQRITNTGVDDLVFYAICSPPFTPQNYVHLE